MLDVNKELQEYRPVELDQQQEPAKAGSEQEQELPEMVGHISRLLERVGKEQFKASRQLEDIFSLLEEEQERERERKTESAKVRQELEGKEKEKEALLQSLLEMADALEDIYHYAQHSDEKAWKEQLALQWQKTGKQLEQLGIRRLEGAGTFFDPRLHTAGEVKAYPGVVDNSLGQKTTPSVVGIAENGSLLVGQDARDQLLLRPGETVMEVKRLMGSSETVLLDGEEQNPPQVAAYVINYLKGCAEKHLGEAIDRAVITVPAYFTDEQRRATVQAGKLAGFKVERIINEPTAAALAYGIDHLEDNQHILIYDLGGGTLDVTVLEMFQGVLEVKASSGNNQLGGKDFDQRLMDYLLEKFYREREIDLSRDKRALARIKDAVEQCKIALSREEEHRVILPFIAEQEGRPLALEKGITREQFEGLIQELVESTSKPIRVALEDAKLAPGDIDLILAVGGSTRIPLVQRFLENELGHPPQSPVDPELAVVMGAAIQGGIINQELSAEEDILITDVCPYTLGIEVVSFVNGFPVNDILSVVISRNTTIPVTREETYYTVHDNQEQVEIMVYQGDHQKASLNNLLGCWKR